MKNSHFLMTLMTVAALAAVPAVFAGLPDYRDWKLERVRVADTNANDNVRLHFDMTNPLNGPWLLNPGYTTMSVNWITREKCGVGIEYRAKGETEWMRRWYTQYGLLDYSKDIHTFHLSGLKPATEYEYRLLSSVSQYNAAYVDTVVGRETYSFRTLDPNRSTYTCFVTTDNHGSLRLGGDQMFENTGAKDADLYFFLGDNVNDNMNEPRFYITTGFLDDVVRLWGTSKPTVFLRGRHDSWGRHAADGWAEFFSRPDGRGYYAIEQGPAVFVIFDCAEEYRLKSPAGREIAEAYRAEQLAWFEDYKKTAAWKNAKFRIGMCHYGTRTAPNDGCFRKFGDQFKASFSGKDGLHLLLCGHEHVYARSLPNTAEVFSVRTRPLRKGQKPPEYKMSDGSYDFTEICGRDREAMMLEISPERLVVRSRDFVNPGAPDFDAVEIFPDRTARVLKR